DVQRRGARAFDRVAADLTGAARLDVDPFVAAVDDPVVGDQDPVRAADVNPVLRAPSDLVLLDAMAARRSGRRHAGDLDPDAVAVEDVLDDAVLRAAADPDAALEAADAAVADFGVDGVVEAYAGVGRLRTAPADLVTGAVEQRSVIELEPDLWAIDEVLRQ